MSGFNIYEQLGVVLLGFGIYDAIQGSWTVSIGGIVLKEGDFSFARGTLVFVFCLLIAASIAISHRTNSSAFSDQYPDAIESSKQMVQRSCKSVWLSSTLAIAAMALAYFGMGPRQLFLVWTGFMFVNFAPFGGTVGVKTMIQALLIASCGENG